MRVGDFVCGIVLVSACGGNGREIGSNEVSVTSGIHPDVKATPYQSGAMSRRAGAAACNSSNPVVCEDGPGCCPLGTVCEEGTCQRPSALTLCAPGRVTCSPAECSDVPCLLLDESGRGHHGSMSAPASFSEGFHAGGAVRMSSIGGDIRMPKVDFPSGNAPVTIELWVDFSGFHPPSDDTRVLVSYGAAGPFSGRRTLGVRESGGARTVGWLDAAECSVSIAGAAGWHFIVASWTGRAARFYLDGVKGSECASSWLETAKDGDLVVGADVGLGYPPYAGTIDDLRVLDYAVTDEEAAADFVEAESMPLGTKPGTVGLWHFEEGCPVRCCASGTSCDASGPCRTPPAPTEATGCPSDSPLDCGDGTCCPTNWTCASGKCLTPPTTAPCPAGNPVRCDWGSNVCCPLGTACEGRGCITDTPPAPRGGPTGPETPDGLFCPTETVPVSGNLCCPNGETRLCGNTCCPEGEVCDSGTCACPDGEPPCGNRCCGPGFECGNEGHCQPSCSSAFPIECGGDACCAPGIVCKDDQCACPADHPVVCGDACCLLLAACKDGVCGCPDGRELCGEDCCPDGEVCANGLCEKADRL